VDAALGTQRQQLSPSSQGLSGNAAPFSLYNASVGVHYNLDLAGGNRRALEALAARTDYRRFELNAARLSLAGSIATSAISRARIAAQLDGTAVILVAQEEQLRLAHERVRIGQVSSDEVLSLQAQAEQTRAELPALRKQLQQTEHRLAVLAGRAPGAGNIPAFVLTDFTLPTELPLVVPSELVRQRPDIQAAEALLHAANADYGVAVAKLYPQLKLTRQHRLPGADYRRPVWWWIGSMEFGWTTHSAAVQSGAACRETGRARRFRRRCRQLPERRSGVFAQRRRHAACDRK